MRPSWIKYLGQRAPRYTSYPSALQFDTSVTADDLTAKLDEVGLYEPLSVYVHIPFCRQRCWYCGCNMRVENDDDRARDYVEVLMQEIALYGRALGGRGQPSSVHFGGGTPNTLLCEDLGRILCAIENEIGLTDSVKVSIELDPRLLRDEDVDHLASLGINRFSLGIQDFDPAVQRAINRLQSDGVVDACVRAIRFAGITDLSFDLLYGLPHQTIASFSNTLERTIALSPDRVSIFGCASA